MSKPRNDCRLPPQNLAAERSVLGSMILDQEPFEHIAAVRQVVSASDFYADVHAKIFVGIAKGSYAREPVDAVTLAGQLESQGDLDDIGGVPYLLEIMEVVPYAANATYYAKLVRGCSRRRAAISIASKILESAYDFSVDEVQMADAAASATAALVDGTLKDSNRKTDEIRVHVNKLIDDLEAGVLPSKFDGIAEVDELTQGTAEGELIIIAAATSNGKSLLGKQIVDEASSHGVPGLVISEEMAAISLASRSLSTITAVPSDRWMNETGRLRLDSREYFKDRAPVFIAEKCGTVASAEREISTFVKSHGVGMVVVDYAQILKGEGFNKQERVADVSARMKGCAMKHGIRVVLLAQLNREIERRDDPTPQLSDIRDSAAIAMDADVVLMPFWPLKFDDTYEDICEYRIYCRKNRNRGIRNECVKMTINCGRQRIEPWKGVVKRVENNVENTQF